MADENGGLEGQKSFSLEYVQELRQEAASYRTKCKKLEASGLVMQELAARGIQADPSWINVTEGQTVGQAVDALVAKFPHLKVAQQPADQNVPATSPLTPTVKPLTPPAQQSTQTVKTADQLLAERNFAEIKKDPKARGALRDHYRELLRQQSHQRENH